MPEENNRTAERKIRQPPDFMGDCLEATNFLNTCCTYLRINKNAYPTEEDKIIFVLLFMEGGIAGPWKNAIMEEAYAVGMDGAEVGFETFAAFIKKFKKAFEPLSPIQDAITKLKALRQTGLAEDYIVAFQPLAAQSEIVEIVVLSDYFLSGLSRGLVKSVLSCATFLNTIEGYYELAV